ncbi:MAG: hypothetical protein WAQ98_25560 [Blastocatellia bacterium]
MQHLSNASDSLSKSSQSVQKLSESQQKILTDKKTQDGIALLLRQGNDLAFTVTKVNTTLDKVNRELLPQITSTFKAGEETLNQTTKTIQLLGSKGEILLTSTDKRLEELSQLLTDRKIQELLSNITDTSKAIKSTSIQIDATAKEVNTAIPELIAQLKAISHNVDDGTKEISTFLAGLNKPETKKQKLFRYLVQAAVIAVPYTLRK